MSPEQPAADDRSPASLARFLEQLKRRMTDRQEPTPLPDEPLADLREVDGSEDLPAQFTRAAEAAGCHVYGATDDDWVAVTQRVLRDCGASSVVAEPRAETALTDACSDNLSTALATANIVTHTRHDDDTLFRVDAAITGVVAAIAETGTIVCVSGAATARGTTLIPPAHVAVVGVAQIVGDLFDYFAQLDLRDALPANLNLITGPSKTADIESVLVTGVHGPGAVYIVLVA